MKFETPEEVESTKNKCTLNDSELVEKAIEWVSKLSKSGGREWSLRIPVDFNHDPDMIFSELCCRFTSRDTAIRKESKWISVKEQLPEDMQRVLVSIYGFTCPTLYTADFIKREIGGIFVPVYDDLTAEHPMSMSQYSISMAEFDIQPSHWMPLPEPPVGKEGEE